MKRKYQIFGFIIILLCSVVYDFQIPEDNQSTQALSYVILEGAFLKTGKYEYEGKKTIGDLVEEIGVKSHANLKALSLDLPLKDESIIYLPIQNQKMVSLNHATKEELMTLDRIGEKTAQKIIGYRQNQPFLYLEDLMNVSGIGKKTYLRLRDYLCL